MKRLFAAAVLVLAALCLALVCVAADEPYISDEHVYVAAPDGVPCEAEFTDGVLTAPLVPGSTIYFVIEGADRAEDLSDRYARVQFDFAKSSGEEYVGTPTIEYRMCYDAAGRRQIGYSYLVAVPITDAGDSDTHLICARVSLRHQKSGSVYFSATVQSAGVLADAVEITCTGGDNVLSFSDDTNAVRLDFEYAVYTVEIAGQAPVNVGVSFLPFTDIAWAYPSAELFCLDWQYEPIFNRIGTLEVPAAPGSYFYEVRGSELCDLTASYTASTGCFTVETRRLGSYVVSDRQLGTPERTELPENPPTGFTQ